MQQSGGTPAEDTETPPAVRPFWSVSSLAAHWGVSKWLVRKLVRSGDLSAHTFGDEALRITGASVAAYEAKTKRPPAGGNQPGDATTEENAR